MTSKDKSAGAVPSDLEIMMFLDGELQGDQADVVARFLEANEEAKAKATSLGQMSELMQVSIELDTDDATDKLDGLWAGIDKAIHANGASEEPLRAVASASQKAEDRATDALVAKAGGQGHGWFGAWQSHIMTGAFVAVAVAVLMIATRPDPAPVQQTVRQAPPIAVPAAALASQDPEVEELEVYDGSGVIMTMPGDDEEGGDSASTVIWISNDTDLVEDPI